MMPASESTHASQRSKPPTAESRSGRLLFALAPAAVLLAFLWPVIAGERTWFLRDLFNYHLGAKAVQARAMSEGFLPLVDPFRAGGQALVGNLNNVALYPDNLLYLVAPALWALNAHLWLHLLLAPVAVFALARVLGLEREACWAAGFCYAVSGFFLSQLNLYNLVGGAALAPAFAAACVAAVASRRPALAAAGAGAAWALLLVAGDPIVAALALVLGAAAVLAAASRERRGLLRLGCALALGTVMAAPQIVELLRVLPSSYRGSLGLTPESRLVSSWDPRTVVEFLVPLFFGRPDTSHWGERVLGAAKPLFFSLYPGLLAAALFLASGRPRSRVTRWAWSMVLCGGFLALGGWNPLMFYLYRLPQAASLRYPIKAWLLVAIGAAVLAGVGFERSILQGSRRTLLRALAIVGGVAGLAWLALTVWNGAAVEALGSRIMPALPATLAVEEVARWRGALLLSLMVVAAGAALTATAGAAPRLIGALLLALHVAAQLVLLRPLLDTDVAAAYRTPSKALSYIGIGERVAHGCPLAFACDLGRPGAYPDWRMSWIERRGWLELYPFAGAQFGLRYAYNVAPEGLDTLLVSAGMRAMRQLDDAGALRLLAASAVEVVLIGRPVDAAAQDLVWLRARLPSVAGQLWIYQIRRPAAEIRLADRIRGGDTRTVLVEMVAPTFDPARDVFVPGRRPGARDGVGGEAVLLSQGWERLGVATRSGADGMLVLGRAWLPSYRATVDGEPAPTLQANLGQLAVEVPAGAHRVDIWVDRGPFRSALLAALAAAVGLCWLAVAGERRERRAGRLSGLPG
jgi:hypothetical protein